MPLDSSFEGVGSWLSLCLSRALEEPQPSVAKSENGLGQKVWGGGDTFLEPSPYLSMCQRLIHTSIYSFGKYALSTSYVPLSDQREIPKEGRSGLCFLVK